MPQRTIRLAQAGSTARNLLITLLGSTLVLAFTLLGARTARMAEIIVDDGDAEYNDTGWSVATNQGYPLDPGMDVRYIASGDGSQTATWTPVIPSTESYDVYISWTTHPNRATNAPYTINHAGGSNTITVNQEQLADQLTAGGSGEWSDWYLAGSFTFDAGTSSTIVLDNAADEYVIADAVRLVSTTPTSSDVSGMKFNDINGNGVKDGDGEPGLPGWTIAAAESFQSFSVDSNDIDGETSAALANGETYLVRVEGTYDAGDSITADAQYSKRAPNTSWTDLVQNYTSYGPTLLDLQVDGVSPDWGPYNDAHVYWLMLTGTGAGANFTLYDLGYGGNVGALSVVLYHVIAQTVTDADGLYTLSAIPSGDFIVAEFPQYGWLQTAPAGGFFAVTAADIYTDVYFGNRQAPAIRGVKFDDTNGNGMKDPGEPGIPGWRIRMRDLTTDAITQIDTDANGAYAFEQLPPGDYRISEKQETGWTQTFPQNPDRYTIALAQGQQADNTDFGNFKHFSLSGIKYEDIDGSGSYDVGEPLLAGWDVVLEGPTGFATTTTDALGAYSFSDLGPGSYTLYEIITDPGTWGQSQPGGDGLYGIEGESGADFTDVNFGNYRHVTVNGRVYRDDNFDGDRDAGDPYLGDWTIELLSLRTGEKFTTTSKPANPNKGLYSFTNVRPGPYYVREILKSNWIPVNPNNTLYKVDFVSGQIASGLDFGNNTVRNYAVWRILHPNQPIQPFSNDTFTPTDLPTPDGTSQTSPTHNPVNAQGTITTPGTQAPTLTPPQPLPLPLTPPALPSFVSTLFSRIQRSQ